MPYSLLPFDVNEPINQIRNLFHTNQNFEKWDFNEYVISTKSKIIKYTTDVNFARNNSFTRLEDEDIILVFDGNCYLTDGLFQDFYAKANRKKLSREKVFVFPMHRLSDLSSLKDMNDDSFSFEPQLGFQANSQIRFNDQFPYGNRSKVELLNRLGIYGYWSQWMNEDAEDNLSEREIDLVSCRGVYRLPSYTQTDDFGQRPHSEKGLIRNESLNEIHKQVLDFHFITEKGKDKEGSSLLSRKYFDQAFNATVNYYRCNPTSMSFVSEENQAKPLPQKFYLSFAPNLRQLSCHKSMDFIIREDRNLDRFDANYAARYSTDKLKLQEFITTIIVLSVEYTLKNEIEILEKIERSLQDFLLDTRLGMYPNIAFSQVPPSNYNYIGEYAGRNIVEFNRFYLFIVGLSRVFSDLSTNVQVGTLEWLRAFEGELEKNKVALNTLKPNNCFTINLLQELSLAIFFGNFEKLRTLFEEVITLYCIQFDQDGNQPLEKSRNSPIHYQLYNIQIWQNIKLLLSSNLSQSLRIDLQPALDRVQFDLSSLPSGEDKRYFQDWIDSVRWFSNVEENILTGPFPNFTEQSFIEGVYLQAIPPLILLTSGLLTINRFNSTK